jgi:hypothetical protein
VQIAPNRREEVYGQQQLAAALAVKGGYSDAWRKGLNGLLHLKTHPGRCNITVIHHSTLLQ